MFIAKILGAVQKRVEHLCNLNTFMNILRIPPMTLSILLANGEARDPHVVGDIVDDECAEPRVAEERYG